LTLMTGSPPPLIFEWGHRPRSAWRLVVFILIALGAHVVSFALFTVRTPPPTRAMPLPSTMALGGKIPGDGGAGPDSGFPFPLRVPVPAAGLELPPVDPPLRYVPTYESHLPEFQKWPQRSSPMAWPEVSGLKNPVLPP
jgi:hypothetical protein